MLTLFAMQLLWEYKPLIKSGAVCLTCAMSVLLWLTNKDNLILMNMLILDTTNRQLMVPLKDTVKWNIFTTANFHETLVFCQISLVKNLRPTNKLIIPFPATFFPFLFCDSIVSYQLKMKTMRASKFLLCTT